MSFSLRCWQVLPTQPATGAYKVVFNFDYSTTGELPSGLTIAPDGTLYGLAYATTGEILFHFTPATGTYHSTALNFPLFNGLPSNPASGLILGPNGNLYGLYHIYATDGLGVFEVHPNGSNLQLFPFYNTIDGGGSPDGLMLASDGNFWMADYTGSSGYGDIISLSPTDGTLLQTFTPFGSSAPVGAYPAVIIQAKDGTLWGSTTQYGKASTNHFADGTVFSLNAGLPPR